MSTAYDPELRKSCALKAAISGIIMIICFINGPQELTEKSGSLFIGIILAITFFGLVPIFATSFLVAITPVPRPQKYIYEKPRS